MLEFGCMGEKTEKGMDKGMIVRTKKWISTPLIAAAVLLTVQTGRVNAAVVDWTAVENTALTYEDGTPAPSSTLLFIGEFLIDDAAVATQLADWLNPAFRDANFRTFGSGEASTSAGNTPGLFQLQSDNDAVVFYGKRISLLAVDVGAQQVGAYSSSLPGWFFPTDADTEGTTAIDIQQLINSPLDAAFIIGSAGSGGLTGGDFGPFEFRSSVRLVLVPEPTTALMVGMGLLGILSIRRRK